MIRFSTFVFAMVCIFVTSAWAAQFDHGRHAAEYAKDKSCAVCHQDGAASIVPDKIVCLECHDNKDMVEAASFAVPATHGPLWALNHNAAARAKSIDCEACHEQSDCLACHAAGFADEMGSFSNNMVNVHQGEFSVSHPVAARTDPQLCGTCHAQRFCQDCHDRFAPEDLAVYSHRRGWSATNDLGAEEVHAKLGIIDSTTCVNCHPGSVADSHEWDERHGREARKNLVTCQVCHPDGDICLRCHSAVSGMQINPHPAGWDNIKGRLEKASGGRVCRKCH